MSNPHFRELSVRRTNAPARLWFDAAKTPSTIDGDHRIRRYGARWLRHHGAKKSAAAGDAPDRGLTAQNDSASDQK
jgi:hypothetical protein